MLNAIALKTLIAALAIIGTVDNHVAKEHLVWALQHQAKPCQSDWRGITPTRNLYATYMSACQLLWITTMTDHDRRDVLVNLRPEFPPGAPPAP